MRLSDLAKTYGHKNVRFMMPARPCGVSWDKFHSEGYPQELKEFYSLETFNREMEAGYKVALRCVEGNYCDEEYYQMDFESISRSHPDHYYVVVIKEDCSAFFPAL